MACEHAVRMLRSGDLPSAAVTKPVAHVTSEELIVDMSSHTPVGNTTTATSMTAVRDEHQDLVVDGTSQQSISSTAQS